MGVKPIGILLQHINATQEGLIDHITKQLKYYEDAKLRLESENSRL